MPASPTVLRAAAATGAVALSGVSVVLVLVSSGAVPPRPVSGAEPFALSPAGGALSLAAAAACWLALVVDARRAFGVALTGLGWLVPALASWPALAGTTAALTLAVAPLVVMGPVLVGAERRTAPTVLLATAAGVAHALSYDPFRDVRCSWTCQPTALPTSGWPLTSVRALLVAAALSGLLRMLRSDAPLGLALPSGLVLAVFAVDVTARPLQWNTGTGALPAAACALVTAAVIVRTCRALALRRRLTALVRGLGTSSAAVQFFDPELGWFRQDGTPIADELPGAVALTATSRAPSTAPSARTVVDGLDPADLLGLENARLEALGRSRLLAMSGVRRRIVEAADAERRRMERDLHDGAQQRLVSVAFLLGALGEQPGVTQASGSVRGALSSLRDVAHGLSDADLTPGRLGEALRSLAGASALPVHLETCVLGQDVSSAAARAIHCAAAGALRDLAHVPGATGARVVLTRTDADLLLTVEDDGGSGTLPGAALRDAADRVQALGGEVLVTTDGGGSGVTVRVPVGIA